MDTKLRWIACLAAFFVLSGFLGSSLGAKSWLEKGKEAVEQLTQGSSGQQALSPETIQAGLKEALKVGTANVVQQLGQTDGFFNNPEIHIPLPDSLNKVQSAMSRIGASAMLDDLELKLNRAAETATPKAKDLFWQAITDMSLEDARSIYNGPKDAATRYFQKRMSPALAREMKPVIEETLSQVGAVQSYDRIMNRYSAIPFVPDVKANLVSHTLDKTLEGLFAILAKEEAAIRSNPAKRTTQLLQQVFGQG